MRQLLLFFAIGFAIPGPAASAAETARTSETALRGFLVKSTPMPRYPDDAVRLRHQGVAVVELETDESGRVAKVTLMEAPSTSLGAAVTEAVGQWRFEPVTTGGKPARLSGKLTFYFHLRSDRAEVLNPAEAAYLGRWSAPGAKR